MGKSILTPSFRESLAVAVRCPINLIKEMLFDEEAVVVTQSFRTVWFFWLR